MTKKMTAKQKRKRQRELMINELSDRISRDLVQGWDSDDEILTARKQLSAAEFRAAIKLAHETLESPLTSAFFKWAPDGTRFPRTQ
jgi:hypothetical protein